MTLPDPAPAPHDHAPASPEVTAPTVGRVVHYRAKTRGYTLPAIVTATRGSLDPEGVQLGDVPDLDSPLHVHLHVLTPGTQVQYQEHNVPAGDGPGTWSWPPRA